MGAPELEVGVKNLPAERKVEFWLDGSLFTAYCYGPEFDQKPVFYPVLLADGTMVNRELTIMDPNHTESKDHPHHRSVFFGYGDVDGLDFWNHPNRERIIHRAILSYSSGTPGRLSVVLDWVDPEGRVMVQELRRILVGGSGDLRWMDHDITLAAGETGHAFNDIKEGMFAIRLADVLREDTGNGRYINAYGWETADQIWGKRSPWVALRGDIGDSPVTIAILDHTSSENHPSYWHARAYGLFSINPFGRKDFVSGSEPVNRKLEPYGSYHFRHRLMVYQGKVSKERLDHDYWEYVK
jgi:hypothetical protein